jgi:hypothetical protein
MAKVIAPSGAARTAAIWPDGSLMTYCWLRTLSALPAASSEKNCSVVLEEMVSGPM